MTGDQVERLHQPRSERPVTLRAQPDPAVARRAPGPCHVAREPARYFRLDACAIRDALGREITDERGQRIEILDATTLQRLLRKRRL